MRFDSTSNRLEVWDGMAWRAVTPMPHVEWPMMDWTCHFPTPHEVQFPDSHAIRDYSQDAIMWALMNCRGLYRFYSHRMPEAYRTPEPSMDEQRAAWVWEFTDKNDAFHFKMRWL